MRVFEKGLAALATLFAVTVGVVACVDDNPVVSGKRVDSDAGVTGPITVVPQPDPPGDDAPDCRHCAETLSTNTSRGTLCRQNQPSSAMLLNDVVDCVCYDKCVTACASYCSGSKQEDSCQPCIADNCIQQINACYGDQASIADAGGQ